MRGGIAAAAMAENAALVPPARAQREGARRSSTLLILASLAFSTLVVAFWAALDATPYDAHDSLGRSMGFNDVFSREHYGIIWRHFSFGGTLAAVGPYEWALLAAHVLAAGLVWKVRNEKHIVRFCLAQVLVFPAGVLGLPFLVLFPPCALFFGADREAYIDIPFVVLLTQASWAPVQVF